MRHPVFQTQRREELSDDAVRLIEFTSDIVKPNETFSAVLFGDRAKEHDVTLTRGRVVVGAAADGGRTAVVNGQVVIQVASGPMFPILKAEVVGEEKWNF